MKFLNFGKKNSCVKSFISSVLVYALLGTCSLSWAKENADFTVHNFSPNELSEQKYVPLAQSDKAHGVDDYGLFSDAFMVAGGLPAAPHRNSKNLHINITLRGDTSDAFPNEAGIKTFPEDGAVTLLHELHVESDSTESFEELELGVLPTSTRCDIVVDFVSCSDHRVYYTLKDNRALINKEPLELMGFKLGKFVYAFAANVMARASQKCHHAFTENFFNVELDYEELEYIWDAYSKLLNYEETGSETITEYYKSEYSYLHPDSDMDAFDKKFNEIGTSSGVDLNQGEPSLMDFFNIEKAIQSAASGSKRKDKTKLPRI